MTHYWWMHWFWITSHLSLCIVVIHSATLSPSSQLEVETELNDTSVSVTEAENSTSTEPQSESEVNRTIFSDNEYSNSSNTNINSNESVIVTGRGREASGSGWSSGAIAGVSVGAVLLCATLVAASSVVLYRRRYLNKPHTLNDKCSNPDSSGYIDDSTIRENSEEMYSLDNDSFLNSLEAMTIQNYWTDTVKHTKL